VTNTSGPSPPSPMPPLPPSEQPVPGLTPQASHNPVLTPQTSHTPAITPQASYNQGITPPTSRPNLTPPMLADQSVHPGAPQHETIPENSSPPIPQRNNIRNRLELDSVSPAIQRPNPMDTPVSPVTPSSPSNRANFSYPSRAPPPGVPKQVPNSIQPLQPHQGQSYQGHQQPTPQQWGEAWNTQQHNGYNEEASRPVPFRVGHTPTPQQQQAHAQPQKQPTLANLKAAAHGIHVSRRYSLFGE
jgi:hypothetical protein